MLKCKYCPILQIKKLIEREKFAQGYSAGKWKHRDKDLVSLITHHKLKLPHGYMNYPKIHQVERQDMGC